MAESTLSLNYSELRQAIAHYLGLSLTSTDWTAEETTLIAMILKRGLRQFYKPPKIRTDQEPHRWSFLYSVDTITTIATYSTGTVAITNGSPTVTLTDGIFPSWAKTHGTLVIDTTVYVIAIRDGDTQLTLEDDWDEDTITEDTYDLRHNGNYDLPDDYGGHEGRWMTHGEGIYKPFVTFTNEVRIRQLRQGVTTRRAPKFAGVRPKGTTVSDTEGQRFEVIFYPIPDQVYIFYYQKIAQTANITADLAYPLGGMAYGEAILASCLATAENQENDIKGVKYDDFVTQLTSAIHEDQTSMQTEFFGYNRDNSDAVYGSQGRGRRGRRNGRHCDSNVIATYNGEF